MSQAAVAVLPAATVEAHEFAGIFPMLHEDLLQALADDIKANGLRHPIVTFDGKILDGRNRLRACEMAGVPPEFEMFRGDAESALRFVVSENVKRRHLTVAQLAIIGPEVHRRFAALAKEREHAGRPKEGSANLRDLPRKASADTAAVLGISPRTVESALVVDRKGAPELKTALRDGKVSVSAAAEIATAPPARQVEITKQTQAEILKAAQAIKRERAEERREKQAAVRATAGWTDDEKRRRSVVEKGGTVVANMKTDLALVGWATKEGLFVQIDRQTDWGNPFNLPDDGTRSYVCESYGIYLKRKPSLLKRLPELRGKVLGCWCHPEQCHGESLINAL